MDWNFTRRSAGLFASLCGSSVSFMISNGAHTFATPHNLKVRARWTQEKAINDRTNVNKIEECDGGDTIE